MLRNGYITNHVDYQYLDYQDISIDHNYSILLQRLSSWFGVSGTTPFWFQSYLSTRTFSVKACIPTHLNLSHSPVVSLKAPGPTPFHAVYHPIKPSNRVIFYWPSSLCGWHPTIHTYLFPRPLFPPPLHSYSLWLTKSPNGCHPTSFVSTLPKQNSS